MDLRTLGRLALKHAKNAVAEELYLRGLLDATRPTMVYGIVNERCNYRCRYCDFWRLENYKDEMTIEEWQNALLSLKELIGGYHVEFSGGEPFIKKGFVDLVEWCHDNQIGWGATTNGSALSEKIIKRVVAAKPFNFNVSIDAHIPDVHDYARGMAGSHAKIVAGLELLFRERERSGLSFPIIIKPVVHSLNFRLLPRMVDWVKGLGPCAINFQPVDRWTKETYDELWIETKDHAELMEVAKELIRMKKAGAPIMNSELTLSVWDKHFREEPAPKETMPCLVGLRNYFIRTNGDVEVCWFYPPIGNVKRQSAHEIWTGEAAKRRREETTACEKLCLFTCLSQKTLSDKAKMALTMVASAQRKHNPLRVLS